MNKVETVFHVHVDVNYSMFESLCTATGFDISAIIWGKIIENPKKDFDIDNKSYRIRPEYFMMPSDCDGGFDLFVLTEITETLQSELKENKVLLKEILKKIDELVAEIKPAIQADKFQQTIGIT